MSHARQQIITALVTALKAQSLFGERVYGTRIYSRNEDELPSASVVFDGETSEPVTMRTLGRLLRRTATFRVIAHRFSTDSVEAALDALAVAVETAVPESLTFGEASVQLTLSATEINATLADQEIGETSLTYKALYYTAATDPSTLL